MIGLIMLFKPSGIYTIEFRGGPKDGEFANVPKDWPDRVVIGADDCDRRTIYERCEHKPQTYRFRGWVIPGEGTERSEH